MFKKGQNFADGVKITIVSMMRLLWFLSGKFWQQTAISRIPLYAVFVELQSQKWTGASHVRQIQLWSSLRNNMCVWNSAPNLGKRLWKHLNCWSKLMGRNAWVVSNATSGLSNSKRVEHQSVKTPGLDDLPYQETTAMSREFMRWFMEIIAWQSERLLRRWESFACYFNQKTSDAPCQCQICFSFADWWVKREQSQNQSGRAC